MISILEGSSTAVDCRCVLGKDPSQISMHFLLLMVQWCRFGATILSVHPGAAMASKGTIQINSLPLIKNLCISYFAQFKFAFKF